MTIQIKDIEQYFGAICFSIVYSQNKTLFSFELGILMIKRLHLVEKGAPCAPCRSSHEVLFSRKSFQFRGSHAWRSLLRINAIQNITACLKTFINENWGISSLSCRKTNHSRQSFGGNFRTRGHAITRSIGQV